MRKQFLEAGRVVGTHGVKGELRVEPWCDSAAFLAKIHTLYWDRGSEELQVVSSRVPKDRYFVQDMLGLTVLDADTGRRYGLLTEVMPTGANDVYQVTGDDKVNYLVPAIPDVIVDVDIDGGIMKIRPMRGIFDDAD